MQVVAKLVPTAKTELSEDGNVLGVHRFDVDETESLPCSGGLLFAAWTTPCSEVRNHVGENRQAVRAHVPGRDHYETFQKLTGMLLLTYALRNADCHAKNIALLYTSRDDASLAPAYDSSRHRSMPVPAQPPASA